MSGTSLDPETLRRIKQLEIRTRRLVSDSFVGAYHSSFKGRGMAFDSVRPYVPGDDVRDIDWNVTARMAEPHVKTFTEERELTVMLLVDASASCFFGTRGRLKAALAAELGAVLALVAARSGDKAGLLVFSDDTMQHLPPRKGRNHVLRVIRELLAVQPGQGTDIDAALRTVSRLMRQRAVLFLLSDFLAPSDSYVQALRLVSQRHDLIAVSLLDPLERAWPSGVGLVSLRDLEAGTVRVVDAGSRRWRESYAESAAALESARQAAFAQARVDHLLLRTDEDIVPALTRFFAARAKGGR